MLVALTREKFEQIIPLIATGPQYAYYWGKFRDFLRRLLISVVAVVAILLIGNFFGEAGPALTLIFGLIAGLYWLWGPVYWASLRNASYRRFKYSGFLRGQVLDVFITEELVGEEQTVNKQGQLVIIENRERRLNLEIGDETGFRADVQAPLLRIHKVITPGQIAELLVLSNQANLGRIAKITDVYIPSHNLWVGDYPYLQRDIFAQVSRMIRD
ncbi:MAG: phosphate ABC transporter permease [Xenococcaceae cyanobacterium]